MEFPGTPRQWSRVHELGYVVVQRSDLQALSTWYKRCIRYAWPCVSVIVRGRWAEVKLDAFTARRQSLTQSGAVAVRKIVEQWDERVNQARVRPTEIWLGPVAFGLVRMPVSEAEQMAAEMLAAARRADPRAFGRPRNQAEYNKRVDFLRRWEHEAKAEKAKGDGAHRKSAQAKGKGKGGEVEVARGKGKGDQADVAQAARVDGKANVAKSKGAQVEVAKGAIGGASAPSMSRSEWSSVVEWHGGLCAYCERRGMLLLRDQLLPAAMGGEHRIGNVVPACLDCNKDKAARAAAEFVASRPDLPARQVREALGIPQPSDVTPIHKRRRANVR